MFEKLLKIAHDAAEAVVGSQTLDTAKKAALKRLIQEKLDGHGEVVDIDFDSKTKRLALDLKLNGEENNLHLVIEEYSIEETSSGVQFVIRRVSASKAWINGLLPSLLPLSVPIPDQYAQAVKILM
jgi:hypothetical protein